MDRAFSAAEYAQEVLDTHFFYDNIRAQQACAGELPEYGNEARLQLGMRAVRAVAAARWRNRARIVLERPADYLQATPAERMALAEPRFEQMDDIQASLAPERHRLQYINALEEHIENTRSSSTASHLRQGQHDVFDALKDFLNAPGVPVEGNAPTKAGYIKMPTGTGKTVVAVELVRALGFPKTLILTSRKDILRQTVGQNGQRGFSQFAPDAHVTSYYQDEQNLDGDVVVMTYASFNNLMAKDELPQSFCDLVICDEAHRALGATTGRNLEAFIKGKISVGLTATDTYAENKSVDQLLPERIYDVGLRESINKGWLSPVQAWLYKTNVEIDQDKQKDFSSAELQRLADVEGRNRKAVEFAKEFVSEGIQGIISCIPGENVRHAADVAELLRSTEVIDKKTGEIRKIRAQELRGDMPEDVRQQFYADYEAGKIDVLTFVDLLVEGWDSHKAKFLINLRPTCSQVFGTQRLGRILRPTGEGFPAQVIDFLDVTEKAQFTTLHALGEYRYTAGKVYGSVNYEEQGTYKKMHLEHHLAESIKKVNLRKVADIIVGRPYEADFSEPLFVQNVAAQLNVSEAAILFIAEQHELAIEIAEGGLGASVTQIREVDRDKIAVLLRDKYEWLRGQTNEWVEEYIQRRQERLAQAQTVVTASVVDMQAEGLREAAAVERQETAEERAKQAEIIAQAREERLAKYQEKNLDKLIRALTKNNISPADFREIIHRKTSDGTILPMDVVHLSMTGKREGIWGEVQETLIADMMNKPFLAVSALNIAEQLGQIVSIDNTIGSQAPNVRCTARVTFNNGRVIEVVGLAKDKKVAQQVAATYIIATMNGVDPETLENPHTVRAGQAKPKAVAHIPEDEELIDIENPKSALYNSFQRRNIIPKFYSHNNAPVAPGEDFYVRLVFKVKGKSYSVFGRGADRKQAEKHASHRALTLHGDVLLQDASSYSKKHPAKPHELIQYLANYTPESNPMNFLTARAKRFNLKPVGINMQEVEGLICETVTINDNFGVKQTFVGSPIDFEGLDEVADKAERRKRREVSRKDAAKKAIEFLLTNTLDGNK